MNSKNELNLVLQRMQKNKFEVMQKHILRLKRLNEILSQTLVANFEKNRALKPELVAEWVLRFNIEMVNQESDYEKLLETKFNELFKGSVNGSGK